ncbi:hypothetical protein [Plastoroseomonas hellenica]|uniref:hypothetical protein n=1 Tax=Plastoroseomonas hellenica TaxID=2687306 RepID=UPI001BA51C71|nr:hypothetical protein [Plastoroseomonas hellenica]MBR0643994.1 hypothetical protein [Plastoroseomonas hellenica]
MAALTADRRTPERDPVLNEHPHKLGVVIYRGALVVLDANGDCEPGRTATGLKAAGRAETGTNDVNRPDGRVRVRRGTFCFANSTAADAIGAGDYGATVYIVDDQTVAKTDGGGTRSAAGVCRGVDAGGVWVEF